MSLVERFREFESEHATFEIEIENVPIWERIRYSVFRDIEQQFGTGQAHTSIDLDTKDNLQGAKLWLRNLVSKNPYLAPSSDVLVVGHPRRKKETDGCWWDIYCDPLHEYCSLDSVHFEKPYLLDHRSPAKTESLRYLELVEYNGTILRKLGLCNVDLDTDELSCLRGLEDDIQRQFDVGADIKSRVQRLLQNRKCRLPLYKRLLDRVNPEIAVVVVSYGKETFIEACKQKGIPVVELQHGVIYPEHFGYTFSGERTKTTFPDYLLTWGEFWKDDVEFPIPDERVIPVGYPYLEESIKKYDNVETKQQLLFISQGTIGEQLSKFAINVQQYSEIDYDIVYKLHPGEYDRWQGEYPWLVDAELEVIDSSEPPLYNLFAESSAQVGVGSTAVYEGLAFELETFVYDCPGSEVLQPLVVEGSAQLISSSEDLAASLGSIKSMFNREYYFEPNSTENTCRTLSELTENATLYKQ
ncbi:hypothetical protein HLRTI_002635 [Halorhabdus tiamatea SARL4B]|nr:hypothetical protein [Halorhabdus tiamatea]ERJ05403.1 hypothetical protein HLRTI_002635 [Halorhabdus tiamatea SARL4B]